MLRVEVLFDSKQIKAMKSGTLTALENEISRRLSSTYPDMAVRVAASSSASLSVTGTKNDQDKERVMSLLEDIWEDDGWLPS